MQITILKRGRYPAATHSQIANVPGKDRREHQRYSESDQVERRQLINSPQPEARSGVKPTSYFAPS
jgi:hypothetical protein